MNQLNKDVSDIGAACLLRDNSGSDKNHQNVVGIPEQSDVSLDPSHRVLIPTILCVGAGSRLLPVSRVRHPKPFIRLADGQSLLQKAFLRGAPFRDVVEVLTVTKWDLFFKTEDEFREVNEAGVTTPLFLKRLVEYSSHCGHYSASC